MKVEYFKEYSQCLQRDMEYKVYGHEGTPVLVFPSQDGRFYDFEDRGMVDTVKHLIERGRIQLFCVDSIDKEGFSEGNGFDNPHRTYMIEQYYYYIVDEIVKRIHELNHDFKSIYTAGCSLGASHAVNFLLRRPDIFKGCIALSGYYDSDLFFKDYHDDNLYRNSPIQYLQGMSYDHPYVEMYRHVRFVLCTGQGAYEDEMKYSTGKMKELFEAKNIPAWIDFWGTDVNHDWDWWRIQFPYFVEKVL